MLKNTITIAVKLSLSSVNIVGYVGSVFTPISWKFDQIKVTLTQFQKKRQNHFLKTSIKMPIDDVTWLKFFLKKNQIFEWQASI